MPGRPSAALRSPLLSALLLALACQAGVGRREIALETAAAMRGAMPEATVELLDELTLRVVAADGTRADVRLGDAYARARNDPASRRAAVEEVVASVREAVAAAGSRVDPSRIVPVVRERTFIEAVGRATAPGAAGGAAPVVSEPLGGSLAVAYVEERGAAMRYLDREALAAAGVEPASLRLLACGNLRRRLPPAIEIEDLDSAYLVVAGGGDESSLVLLDELFTRERFAVAGDFVVALPARDVLLVTGSDERRGLAKVRRSAGIASRRGDHPISKALYRRRPDGSLVPFADPRA